LNFEKVFGIRKLEFLAYHATLFAGSYDLVILEEHRLVTDGYIDTGPWHILLAIKGYSGSKQRASAILFQLQ